MASRGSSAWRSEAWGGNTCYPSKKLVRVLCGEQWLWAHPLTIQAWAALARVCARHGYRLKYDANAGSYNCRKITGGSTLSAHAYGIAADFNPSTNPYRKDRLVTDMPRAMIDEIESIDTVDGVKVFRWGGDWDGRPETPHSNYDAMHFEVVATPEELQRGLAAHWRTAMLPAASEPYGQWPALQAGDRGPLVAYLQSALGIEADGKFGSQTRGAVFTYQRDHGLTPDGIVGPATWTALFTEQPRLASAEGAAPQKSTNVL